MSRLNKHDYLEIGQGLEYGQKVRVNHDTVDCTGDSKSLLIERKEDGTILAYCFRCGGRGVHNTSTLKSIQNRARSIGIDEHINTDNGESQENNNFPPAGISDINKWPPKARLWIRQYGITDGEIDKHGITYSDELRRIIIPVFDGEHCCSYQTRKIYDDDQRPKYVTYINSNGIHFIPHGVAQTDNIVIVEDTLSGIKCARYCDALVLHSTSLSAMATRFLIHKEYKSCIIFLDDDNVQVKRNALKIKNLIDKFGSACIIQSGGRDPKEFSDLELQEILK